MPTSKNSSLFTDKLNGGRTYVELYMSLPVGLIRDLLSKYRTRSSTSSRFDNDILLSYREIKLQGLSCRQPLFEYCLSA